MTNASEVLSSIQSAFPGAVLDSRVESDRRLWATIDSKKHFGRMQTPEY